MKHLGFTWRNAIKFTILLHNVNVSLWPYPFFTFFTCAIACTFHAQCFSELLCRIPLALQFLTYLSRIGLLSTAMPLLINEYQVIVNCAALSRCPHHPSWLVFRQDSFFKGLDTINFVWLWFYRVYTLDLSPDQTDHFMIIKPTEQHRNSYAFWLICLLCFCLTAVSMTQM